LTGSATPPRPFQTQDSAGFRIFASNFFFEGWSTVSSKMLEAGKGEIGFNDPKAVSI